MYLGAECTSTRTGVVAKVCRNGGRFENPIPTMFSVGSTCCNGDLGRIEKTPEPDEDL